MQSVSQLNFFNSEVAQGAKDTNLRPKTTTLRKLPLFFLVQLSLPTKKRGTNTYTTFWFDWNVAPKAIELKIKKLEGNTKIGNDTSSLEESHKSMTTCHDLERNHMVRLHLNTLNDDIGNKGSSA